MKCQAGVRFVTHTHTHTHTHPHTFRAFIILGQVALCLDAAVLTHASWSAFSAVVVDVVELARCASLAFGSQSPWNRLDEFLARSALGD